MAEGRRVMAGAEVDDGAADVRQVAGPDRRGRLRRVVARVATALAGLLVLVALDAPNEMGRLTPGAFARVPLEGLLGVALLLVLPARARRPAAVLLGVTLGLLTILKVLDMGFYAVLVRPFDLVRDWSLLGSGMDFLTESMGRPGAVGTVVAVLLLAVAVPALSTLAVLRLTHVVAGRPGTAGRVLGGLGAGWLVCAVLGAQLVPGVPVADHGTADLVHDRARQVRAGFRDQATFAAEARVDAFRDTPGDHLLTALRGKDVMITFVESYGRDAVEDPEFAPRIGALLDDGYRRLRAAGFDSRSAFLTSPTAGGGSWLAQSTLMSGLWIDNQGRYVDLVASDRLTLGGAFRRANWRTVGVVPAIIRSWPESEFFGLDEVYDSRRLGYRGPPFGFAPMPDQYTLSVFQRKERAAPRQGPVMAEVALISSHSPWTPTPRLIDWPDVDDGPAFAAMPAESPAADVVWRDPARVRAEYRRSIEYSLSTLISYLETYGGDDLVLVFLGDHQPVPLVTGAGASRDVPITIVSRDPAVLDRTAAWNWQPGLRPGPGSPVWRMDAFRDRFLTAFGPQAPPARAAGQAVR